MIVGLTGGIGTGKSTISRMFRNLGATVISADDLGHEVMHSTGEAYNDIIDRFGPVVPVLVQPDGQINRRALGIHVFLNPGEMEDLERIVHPAVGRKFEEFAVNHENDETIIIYECAILFENDLDVQMDPPMTYTIATWCPFEEQVTRIMQRDRLQRTEALQRIEKQMPADVKRHLADFDIDTTLPDNYDRVKYVYETLIKLLAIRKEVRALLVNAKLTDNYPDPQIVTAEQAGPLSPFEG